MSAGKGSSPRNCFSKAYRDGYDHWKQNEAKRQKMHGVKTSHPSCWNCCGRGKVLEPKGELDEMVVCKVCGGRKTMPMDEWRKKLFAKVKLNENH